MNFDRMLEGSFPTEPWKILRHIIQGPPYNHTVTRAAQLLCIGRPALSNVLSGNAAISERLAFNIERVYRIEAEPLLRYQAALKYRQWLKDNSWTPPGSSG